MKTKKIKQKIKFHKKKLSFFKNELATKKANKTRIGFIHYDEKK